MMMRGEGVLYSVCILSTRVNCFVLLPSKYVYVEWITEIGLSAYYRCSSH